MVEHVFDRILDSEQAFGQGGVRTGVRCHTPPGESIAMAAVIDLHTGTSPPTSAPAAAPAGQLRAGRPVPPRHPAAGPPIRVGGRRRRPAARRVLLVGRLVALVRRSPPGSAARWRTRPSGESAPGGAARRHAVVHRRGARPRGDPRTSVDDHARRAQRWCARSDPGGVIAPARPRCASRAACSWDRVPVVQRRSPQPWCGSDVGRCEVASAAMQCPACGALEDRVVDSRAADDGTSIRRRRQCEECSTRFTTFERRRGRLARGGQAGRAP